MAWQCESLILVCMDTNAENSADISYIIFDLPVG